MKTGNRIKEYRIAAHKTQLELADAIGVNRVTITKYENGSITPPIDKLEKIAAALGCYVHELIETEETAEGLTIFDNPEEFEVYRQSMLKNIDDLERSKLDMLIENASRLNDTGVMLLTTISHVLSTAEELTKSGMAINYEDELTNGK